MQEPKSSLTSVIENLQQGEFSRAEQDCRDVLQREPGNAKAWHLCGIIHAQQGDVNQAVDCLETAVKLRPDVANYHYNLGLAYRELDRLDESIGAYRAAIERNPVFVEAHNNLGNALVKKGAAVEAIECFRNLVAKFPDDSVGYYNLANVLQDHGQVDEAIALFRRAIELNPDFSSARENLGRALSDVTRFDEALEVWRSWLEHDPHNPIAKHMIASITGEKIPDRCDDDYVRGTFDEAFATNFEQQLKRLDYNAPGLIGEAIRTFGASLANRDILDAGCGTGLCAPMLRPMSARLIGVDLSADMLHEADKRQIYDALVEDELTQYFVSHPDSFDVIVSADTLCYFGGLDEVLSAAFRCLRRGGVLFFTVEHYKEADDTVRFDLQPNGRYRHSETYARKALTDAGIARRAVDAGNLAH